MDDSFDSQASTVLLESDQGYSSPSSLEESSSSEEEEEEPEEPEPKPKVPRLIRRNAVIYHQQSS